jgi:acetyl/propionyl-CoA carboxylase alpha subunit
VYAEDPFRDFLPSTGNVLKYVEPPLGTLRNGDDFVRVDSGIVEGFAISPFFDPMISKLVAYSPHGRQSALDALESAVDRYVIRGVNHNLPFVSDLLRHPECKAGNTPTNFIPKHYPSGFHGVQLSHDELCTFTAVAAFIHGQWERVPRKEDVVICVDGVFGQPFSVSNATMDKTFHVRPLANDGMCMDESLDRHIHIEGMELDPSSLVANVVIQGHSRALQV